MNAQRICHTLADLTRHGGCIVAQCQCGRAALFSIYQLAALFKQRRWPSDMRSVGERLRCTGCGRRGQRAWYAQPPVPAWGGSLCMTIWPPKGIGPIEWARADERERRRMVQKLRG